MIPVELTPVELMELQVEPSIGASIMLLEETGEPRRVLRVFIGTPEAIFLDDAGVEVVDVEEVPTDDQMTADEIDPSDFVEDDQS